MRYELCVIGTKDTTIKLIEHLTSNAYKVDCIITVNENYIDTKRISGFKAVYDFGKKNGITVFATKDYSLEDDESVTFFDGNIFGIGICMGWQRLIPKYVLDRFEYGIFGFHGSCGYLPYGRGRSPLNWSIINGDTRFILNLFQYDEEADSPNVYRNVMFEINEYDTIRTLQYKNLLVSYGLIESLIQDYKSGTLSINTRSKDVSTIYKKRSAKDGLIDFNTMKTRDIYNLVRGVTHPFPGAFSYIKNKNNMVKIWKANPFDSILDFSDYEPGEIVDIFDNNIVVRTIDGSLIMTSYESDDAIEKGDVFVALHQDMC